MRKAWIRAILSSFMFFSGQKLTAGLSAVNQTQFKQIKLSGRYMRLIFTLFFLLGANCTIGQIGFFESDCPDGWEPYSQAAGRTIIGWGHYLASKDSGFSEERNYSQVGEKDGEMRHYLTIEEMPRHDHCNGGYCNMLQTSCLGTAPGSDWTCGEPDLITSSRMSQTGGSKAHNNMPPYLVLKVCKQVNETQISVTKGTITQKEITTNAADVTNEKVIGITEIKPVDSNPTLNVITIVIAALALLLQLIQVCLKWRQNQKVNPTTTTLPPSPPSPPYPPYPPYPLPPLRSHYKH